VFSLRGNGVYDIFCDENKRIWVCTYSGGLSFFEQSSPIVNQIAHQVNNINSLSNNNVNKVIEDRRGNLWFATDNGICCWDRQSNKWKTYYHNKQEQAQVFLSLCEDDRGRIWAGSFSSGVYVIDVPVYAFSELSPTQMLAACTFGLCSLDKQTGKSELLLDGYLLQDILFMDGNVWLCTCGDGLIRFDLNSKTKEQFTTESGLPSNYVNSIMWADGYLWLGIGHTPPTIAYSLIPISLPDAIR
jgi:ligand-binding sensor domain-containing protein